MIDSALLKIIDFWQKVVEEKGLRHRQLVDKIDTETKEVIDIVGPRRSGKSSIMKIIIKKLKTKGGFLYINFEDPYFIDHNTPQVIEELIETYKEYYQTKLNYLFFDEVQNITSWEKAVRKLRDGGQYKIFVSGSSSKLLSSELASLLSGRHLSYQLLPLSFAEYLAFQGVAIREKKDIILKEKALLKHFGEYLEWGGFPAVVLEKNQELLKQYYLDMIQKDIVKRYEIREKTVLEKMGVYLLTNSAKTISVSAIKNLYGISHEPASTYLDYFKDAFLVFELPQFSYSIKRQQKALKKIYAVDTGLANNVSFRFSQDKGRILETSVFLSLKQQGKETYYYKTKSGREVDFLIKDNGKVQLIQVAWDIEDEKTKQREIGSLVEAMEEEKVGRGLVLTFSTNERTLIKNRQIQIRPVYQWLLEQTVG
jgi:predicted AAA+ superfamily ATPase